MTFLINHALETVRLNRKNCTHTPGWSDELEYAGGISRTETKNSVCSRVSDPDFMLNVL